MTTATLTSPNMASAQPSSVGFALKELGLAARQLAIALWASAAASFRWETPEMTAQQAAQALRVFASSVAASDPGFASDLFAAADRHEFGDNA
ncbi:MAG: hypothetical protein V4858_01930 [Pseudomonadota bacterium]